MTKMFATCLVVAHVLVGCGVSPMVNSEAPTRERAIGKSANSQQRQVLPMDKVQKGTYLGKEAPASHGLTMSNPAGGAAPGGLRLERPAEEMDVIPVLTDEGELDRLMFSPESGALTWEVSAIDGPVAVKTVRLTLKSVAEYPPSEESATASQASTGGLKILEGEPVTVDLDTAALKWPPELNPGSRTKLAFSLKGEAIRDYLAKVRNLARVEVKLQFLDRDGETVRSGEGEPFVLTETVNVF